MVKKKSGSNSNIVKRPAKKRMTAREREELLIENFVGLQRVMVNFSSKFEQLSDNIERLLEIFELSAKNHLQGGSKEGDVELLKKIDSLLDQNKTIAKGLVLMESKVRGRVQPTNIPQQQRPGTRPLPRI